MYGKTMSSPFKKLIQFDPTPMVDLLSTTCPRRTTTMNEPNAPKLAIQDAQTSRNMSPNESSAPLQARCTLNPSFTDVSVTTPQGSSDCPKEGFTAKLKQFDHAITQPYRNRFNDLKELLDQPLYEYLSQGSTCIGTVSLKMRVLGKSEQQAKPWIIVLCDTRSSRRAKRFFNQKHIKELCHGEQQDDTPPFDVVVCEFQPTLRTDEGQSTVYTLMEKEDLSALKTLCGLPIAVNVGDQTRLGSLGGLVIVEHLSDPRLYGLTARHIFEPAPNEPDDDQLTTNKSSFSSSDDSSDDGSEFFELDLSPKQRDEFAKDFSKMSKANVKNITRDNSVCELGRLSPWTSDEAKNCDWALIELTIPVSEFSHPNLLQSTNTLIHIQNIAGLGSHAIGRISPKEDVVILSSNGTKEGQLSKSSDAIIITPGTSFSDAFTLKLSGSEGKLRYQRIFPLMPNIVPSGLDNGDSGAWVVGLVSHCVYGQVVASDILGDVYVIPAVSILEQIERCIGHTARVRLPQLKISKAEQSEALESHTLDISQANHETPKHLGAKSFKLFVFASFLLLQLSLFTSYYESWGLHIDWEKVYLWKIFRGFDFFGPVLLGCQLVVHVLDSTTDPSTIKSQIQTIFFFASVRFLMKSILNTDWIERYLSELHSTPVFLGIMLVGSIFAVCAYWQQISQSVRKHRFRRWRLPAVATRQVRREVPTGYTKQTKGTLYT